MEEKTKGDLSRVKVESILIKLVIDELIADGLIEYHTFRNLKLKVLFEILIKNGIQSGEAVKFAAEKFQMEPMRVRNIVYSKKIKDVKECFSE